MGHRRALITKVAGEGEAPKRDEENVLDKQQKYLYIL